MQTTTPPDPAIPANLRRLRLDRGWTQREAAGKVGVYRETWARWEAGVYAPPVGKLRAIAEALGVDIGELFTMEAAA